MSELFRVVLSLSLSGSVLILAALLCNALLRNRLSKRFQYYIWLVVVARLLLPFAPEQSILPALWQQDAPAQHQLTGPQDVQEPSTASAEPTQEAQPPTLYEPQMSQAPEVGVWRDVWNFVQSYIWMLWLAVAAGLLIRKVTLYQSFVKYLRAGERPVEDLDTLNRFAELCEELELKRPVELYTNHLIASPLMLGFVKPSVVLPSLPENKTTFRYICLHELTHCKRGDIFYKWLLQLTLCIHWFNPLVHLMVKIVGRGCELSCDETVLHRLDALERNEYGSALLESLQTPGTYREGVAALTLNEGVSSLKERLAAIMRYNKPSKGMALVALLLAALLFTGGYALGAYSVEPESFNIEANDDLSGESIAQPEEYSEYSYYARTLMEQAHPVFTWYYSEMPYEELWIPDDAPAIEAKDFGLDNGLYYKKVERFSSIEELKAATEAVFTKEFCEANFYDLIEAYKFVEMDGILYVGDNGGISEGATTPPKNYVVSSVEGDKAVLTAICEGPDPNANNPSNVPLIDYSFELVLCKVYEQTRDMSPIDCWRVNSYYSYDTNGFRGDLQPYHGGQPDSAYSSPNESDGTLALGRLYLEPVFYAGMTASSWENSADIEADNFVLFYSWASRQGSFRITLPDDSIADENGDMWVDASYVEEAVLGHFDVSAEHLHESRYYDAEKNTYMVLGLGGLSSCEVTEVRQEENQLMIEFEGYQDLELFQTGTLYVDVARTEPLYLSCRVVTIE